MNNFVSFFSLLKFIIMNNAVVEKRCEAFRILF